MKKIYLTTLLFSMAIIGHKVHAYPTGSNFLANYSGAINGLTCNNTTCHTGSAVNSGPGSVSITTNIPITGYVAGEIYQITVTVTSGGSNGVKYGFACSAVKEGTTTVTGGFVATDATTFTNNGSYIVHNIAPNGNGNTSHTFTFNWTAPAGGTGSVKFFAAGNSANGNGDNSGDQIYNSSISVIEQPGFGLTESILSAFNLYPNPAAEFVSVKVPESLMNSQIRIMDITGKTVFSQQLIESIVSLDINTIPAGIYVVEILKDGQSYTSRLVKN